MSLALSKPLEPGDAVTLAALEARQNNGRGVSCVKSIIFYLNAGESKEAQAVFYTEHDKIRSYPEIDALIHRMFPKEKHEFWDCPLTCYKD